MNSDHDSTTILVHTSVLTSNMRPAGHLVHFLCLKHSIDYLCNSSVEAFSLSLDDLTSFSRLCLITTASSYSC